MSSKMRMTIRMVESMSASGMMCRRVNATGTRRFPVTDMRHDRRTSFDGHSCKRLFLFTLSGSERTAAKAQQDRELIGAHRIDDGPSVEAGDEQTGRRGRERGR